MVLARLEGRCQKTIPRCPDSTGETGRKPCKCRETAGKTFRRRKISSFCSSLRWWCFFGDWSASWCWSSNQLWFSSSILSRIQHLESRRIFSFHELESLFSCRNILTKTFWQSKNSPLRHQTMYSSAETRYCGIVLSIHIVSLLYAHSCTQTCKGHHGCAT